MATLAANTVVRHPETGEVVSLAEGSEVPAWATSLLGEHLFAAEKKAPASKSDSGRSRRK